MCIRCVSKSKAVRLLSSWGAGSAPCALARALGGAEAQAPRAAGVRLYSSMPQPAEQHGGNVNELEGKVAHPTLLNADLLKAQYAVRQARRLREGRGLRGGGGAPSGSVAPLPPLIGVSEWVFCSRYLRVAVVRGWCAVTAVLESAAWRPPG